LTVVGQVKPGKNVTKKIQNKMGYLGTHGEQGVGKQKYLKKRWLKRGVLLRDEAGRSRPRKNEVETAKGKSTKLVFFWVWLV